MMDHPEIFLFWLLFEDMNDFLGFFALSLKKMDKQKMLVVTLKEATKTRGIKFQFHFGRNLCCSC